MSKFYPDIKEFLEKEDKEFPINLKNLDSIIKKVSLKSGLTEDQIKIIIKEYFQYIRKEMLNGNCIVLTKLGRLFIASPKTTGTKRKTFIKFKSSRYFSGKLNDRSRKS